MAGLSCCRYCVLFKGFIMSANCFDCGGVSVRVLAFLAACVVAEVIAVCVLRWAFGLGGVL